MSQHIEFEYGSFIYDIFSVVISGSKIDLLKGKFKLDVAPIFFRDFQADFIIYDFKTIQDRAESIDLLNRESLDHLYCLGPYFPRTEYDLISPLLNDFNYPIFSDILLNSKSGKLQKMEKLNMDEAKKKKILGGRLQELQILSSFFATILKEKKIIQADFIIPVPPKPMYSFNSVDIIAQKIGSILRIDLEKNLIMRTSDAEKQFQLNRSKKIIENSKIILVDDIFTKGETIAEIGKLLRKEGCKEIILITLGFTDHKIYY